MREPRQSEAVIAIVDEPWELIALNCSSALGPWLAVVLCAGASIGLFFLD